LLDCLSHDLSDECARHASKNSPQCFIESRCVFHNRSLVCPQPRGCVLSLGEMLASLALDSGFVPPRVLAENRQESVGVSPLLIHLLGGKGKWLVAQALGGGEPLDAHASSPFDYRQRIDPSRNGTSSRTVTTSGLSCEQRYWIIGTQPRIGRGYELTRQRVHNAVTLRGAVVCQRCRLDRQ
jgi:hypothetical protein